MISVIGISHRTAPLDVRERFAVTPEQLGATAQALRDRFGSIIVLSTCNRTELYLSRAASSPEADAEQLQQVLLSLAPEGNAPDLLPEHLYVLSGSEAARHLLRVASGLDSMVMGEDQILGQVRTAFTSAAEAATTDRLLSRLFHLAIATGRRVRTQTRIGRYTRSVSTAAIDAAQSRLGDLGAATVLVFGAGEAGKLTARNLAEAGVGRLLLFNRTHARAEKLAEALGGEAVDKRGLARALAEADLVVGASAAPDYQVTHAMVRHARGESPARPLLIIDIAVPRDVDPVVAEEPGVTLLDIDGLRSPGDEAGSLDDLVAAESIVQQEVDRLEVWWDTLRVVPTISALRERAESIRQAELSRSFGRLKDLTPEERARIEAMTAAIVNKMLHHPISKLKQPGAGERYALAVQELFDLPAAAGADL